MPDPRNYAEMIWRQEADALLRRIDDYEHIIADEETMPRLVEFWQLCLDHALRQLRSLERIRDSACHALYPPLQRKLAEIGEEKRAA